MGFFDAFRERWRELKAQRAAEQWALGVFPNSEYLRSIERGRILGKAQAEEYAKAADRLFSFAETRRMYEQMVQLVIISAPAGMGEDWVRKRYQWDGERVVVNRG